MRPAAGKAYCSYRRRRGTDQTMWPHVAANTQALQQATMKTLPSKRRHRQTPKQTQVNMPFTSVETCSVTSMDPSLSFLQVMGPGYQVRSPTASDRDVLQHLSPSREVVAPDPGRS